MQVILKFNEIRHGASRTTALDLDGFGAIYCPTPPPEGTLLEVGGGPPSPLASLEASIQSASGQAITSHYPAEAPARYAHIHIHAYLMCAPILTFIC